MKILKLLNKKNFSILLIFFLLFFQNLSATDTVDIWNLEEKKDVEKSKNDEINENQKITTEMLFETNNIKKKKLEINEEKNLSEKRINIVGIYDPSENDLSMQMWVNSNGEKILEIIKKINNIDLSTDATEILNIALLTNSYFPNKNWCECRNQK